MSEHPCPRCGELTEGSVSEYGDHWAICTACMDAEHRMRRQIADEMQRERRLKVTPRLRHTGS